MKRGNLIVLSGPSGVGKGTVLRRLLKDYKDIEYSISATTRPGRKGEIHGKDYFFLSEEEFFQMVDNNQFIEWAKVHNNYYGRNDLSKLDVHHKDGNRKNNHIGNLVFLCKKCHMTKAHIYKRDWRGCFISSEINQEVVL